MEQLPFFEPKILELKAKLQQKKSALRKELAEMGVQKREGENSFDRYKYFSEAQYKSLFTKLFSKHGLELRSSEVDYKMYQAEGKQPNGRIVKCEFELIDTETGYSETSYVSGEGLDKGDKAGYKAATGAVKYYLADTFLVATGDDAEKESPEAVASRRTDIMATKQQIDTLSKVLTMEQTTAIMDKYGIKDLAELDRITADRLIKRAKETANE